MQTPNTKAAWQSSKCVPQRRARRKVAGCLLSMRGDLVDWARIPGSQDRAETEDRAQGPPNLRVQRKQRKREREAQERLVGNQDRSPDLISASRRLSDGFWSLSFEGSSSVGGWGGGAFC